MKNISQKVYLERVQEPRLVQKINDCTAQFIQLIPDNDYDNDPEKINITSRETKVLEYIEAITEVIIDHVRKTEKDMIKQRKTNRCIQIDYLPLSKDALYHPGNANTPIGVLTYIQNQHAIRINKNKSLDKLKTLATKYISELRTTLYHLITIDPTIENPATVTNNIANEKKELNTYLYKLDKYIYQMQAYIEETEQQREQCYTDFTISDDYSGEAHEENKEEKTTTPTPKLINENHINPPILHESQHLLLSKLRERLDNITFTYIKNRQRQSNLTTIENVIAQYKDNLTALRDITKQLEGIAPDTRIVKRNTAWKKCILQVEESPFQFKPTQQSNKNDVYHTLTNLKEELQQYINILI